MWQGFVSFTDAAATLTAISCLLLVLRLELPVRALQHMGSSHWGSSYPYHFFVVVVFLYFIISYLRVLFNVC